MKASMLIFTVETVETDQLTANLEVKIYQQYQLKTYGHMFGCSKIKYVKPSLVTYHLSSVTCLILQPWLGLGTWFFWQWVLKRSTCGADRHVIA